MHALAPFKPFACTRAALGRLWSSVRSSFLAVVAARAPRNFAAEKNQALEVRSGSGELPRVSREEASAMGLFLSACFTIIRQEREPQAR